MILFVRGIYPPEIFESTQKYNCPLKTARHPHLVAYIQQIVRSIRAELLKDTVHRICIVTLDPTAKAIDRFVFEMSVLRSFEERLISDATSHRALTDDHRSEEHQPTKQRKLDKGKGRAIDDDRLESEGTNIEEDRVNLEEAKEEDNDDDDEPLYRMTAQERSAKQQRLLQQQHQQQQHRENFKLGSTIALTTDLELLFRSMLLKISVQESTLPRLVSDCSFTVVMEMKRSGSGPELKADFPWSPISSSSVQERSKLSASRENPQPDRRIIPVKTIDIADVQLELYIEQLGS
ncbi:MAD2 mitotic arrest deficient-like 2 [Mortierella alpina]|nr:MAD2 mitotic arrest deficient-like 2 [Mortierella alpina]